MKFAYYPGCSLHATGIEYNLSTKRVADRLGIEFWEISDWNCCGSSAAHNVDHLLAIALPARNLAIAEKEGLDVAVPCAACFNRMKVAEQAVRESPGMKESIANLIELEYEAKNSVRCLLDVMVNVVGLEAIAKHVVRPLTGLKAACYYGCLLVRPPKTVQFDDPEDPRSMDNLVEALGATSVDWAFKTECCGASYSTTRTDIALHLLFKIFKNAQAAGANCLVSACPLCFLNLDMRQDEVERRYGVSFRTPIFYFTELMGLAFGYSPKELGLTSHFVDPTGLVNSVGVSGHSGRRREEA